MGKAFITTIVIMNDNLGQILIVNKLSPIVLNCRVKQIIFLLDDNQDNERQS